MRSPSIRESSAGTRRRKPGYLPARLVRCLTLPPSAGFQSDGPNWGPTTSTSQRAARRRASRSARPVALRSEEHTSELQSQSNLVCRLLLEKKKNKKKKISKQQEHRKAQLHLRVR